MPANGKPARRTKAKAAPRTVTNEGIDPGPCTCGHEYWLHVPAACRSGIGCECAGYTGDRAAPVTPSNDPLVSEQASWTASNERGPMLPLDENLA